MKKILVTIMAALMLYAVPVSADNGIITVEIPVEVENGGTVKIEGERNLPEITEIKDKGEFVITYNNPTPGDVYEYTISQIEDSDLVIYDESIYKARVYISYEKESGELYGTVIIKHNDDNEKPDSCRFVNDLIKGSVIVEYRDEDTGELLKAEEYICEECEIGTPYQTTQLTFDGYRFSRMAEESALINGTVNSGIQRVTYLYKQKKGNVLVIYKVEGSDVVLKDLAYVVENGKIGSPYKTEQLSFDEYVFSKMDSSSAPKEGTVMEGDQTVIYLYRKKASPIIPPEIIKPVREFVATGAGKAVIAAGVIAVAAGISLVVINKGKKKKKDEQA